MISKEKVLAFAKATNYKLCLPKTNKLWSWSYFPVETRRTIADFVDASRTYWAETPVPIFGIIGGVPFAAFLNAKVRKRDSQSPMTVLDFGEVRMRIPTNLAEDFEFTPWDGKSDSESGTAS